MGLPAYSESQINFFDEQILPLSDNLYRFYYALTLSHDMAWNLTIQLYVRASADIESLQKLPLESCSEHLFKVAWQLFKEGGKSQATGKSSGFLSALSSLSNEQRVAIVLTELLGFTSQQASEILGWNVAELDKYIADASASLLAGDQSPGDAAEKWSVFKGKLQFSAQSYYLNENQRGQLKALVQDPMTQQTIENARIEELGRLETVSLSLRWGVFAVLLLVLGGFIYKQFFVSETADFNPLEYLAYEAIAMSEDPSRLDLLTNDGQEIRDYLKQYPSLDFNTKTIRLDPREWHPHGVAVIDYDGHKTTSVVFQNIDTKEKLFHFSYIGSLADIKKSEPGNMKGFIYQAYTTDDFNLIAWQQDKDVVSFLIGYRSAPELAEMAMISANH